MEFVDAGAGKYNRRLMDAGMALMLSYVMLPYVALASKWFRPLGLLFLLPIVLVLVNIAIILARNVWWNKRETRGWWLHEKRHIMKSWVRLVGGVGPVLLLFNIGTVVLLANILNSDLCVYNMFGGSQTEIGAPSRGIGLGNLLLFAIVIAIFYYGERFIPRKVGFVSLDTATDLDLEEVEWRLENSFRDGMVEMIEETGTSRYGPHTRVFDLGDGVKLLIVDQQPVLLRLGVWRKKIDADVYRMAKVIDPYLE